MRTLDAASKAAVQQVIAQNDKQLESVPGFVKAEPGFPLVNGSFMREPAIIVFVSHKRPPDSLLREERLPRQLGPYRVSVMQASPLQQLEAAAPATPEIAMVTEAITESAQGLTYEPPEGGKIDQAYEIKRPLLCHAGPDAGWPVLRPFLEAAESSIAVAMYDFNADYIAKTFIECLEHNGVRGELTWDNGMTSAETAIRTRLRTLGNLDAGIVQCGGGHRFASAYHEKVAVRDSSSFWLSSGNWSLRSQPNIDPIGTPADAKGMYSKGNREWHVIVEDEQLSQVFEAYIQFDLAGCKDEASAGEAGAVLDVTEPVRLPDLFVPIDSIRQEAALAATVADPTAPQVLPSTARTVKVQPLLTPDNYLGHIVKQLKAVKRSVFLQFAYINYSDKALDKEFTQMLQILAKLSWKPGVDVRIIVGSNGAADKIRLLVQAGFNEKVFRRQANIHNKGIVFDGSTVLVSSANWSGDGVLRNRDAGLLIFDKEVAQYYEALFREDWDERATAFIEDDAPVRPVFNDEPTPPGMARMTWLDYYT